MNKNTMLFTFKNLGIVEYAEIEVGGLTVITGLNDTGKSFLSKSIYSLIKTSKEAEEQSRIIKFQQLQQNFSQIQNAERVSIAKGPGIARSAEENAALGLINSTDLFNKINASLGSGVPLSTEIEQELKNYRIKIFQNFTINTYPPVKQSELGQMNTVDGAINTIMNLSTITNYPEKDNSNFYNKVIIQQLFKGQLNSIKNPDSVSEISVKNDKEEVLNLKIKNNVAGDFSTSEISGLFSDSILIESPILLQLVSFILNGLAFGGAIVQPQNLVQPRIAGLPYHFYDLTYKIVTNAGNSPSEEFIHVISNLQAIIGGRLFYDPVTRSIYFEKDNEGVVKENNIASGIKSLGTLGMLLSENVITKKTLLIIDEPEVHLHPKWEVEYAKIIINLCNAGVPIVISSHSPYLIEALAKYSEGIKCKANFYFGEKSESGTSEFKNVTSDLTRIFSALAEPMKNI